jgi:hypothetical protein
MAETGIDRLIGEWWAQTATLSALVPLNRVVASVDEFAETEQQDENEDDFFDDAVVFTITTEPAWRTNSQRGYKSILTLSCLAINYDDSKTIGQEIVAQWADRGFTGTASKVIQARPAGQLTTEQDTQTGIWETQVQLEIMHTGV